MDEELPVNINVNVFDRDAMSYGGYLYTTNTSLSSWLATQRTTDVILQTGCFTGRRVLDMACGDGFYTIRFWDHSAPLAMTGVVAACRAVQVANVNRQNRPIQFVVGDVHALPWPDNSFDVALVQSVLHHDDNPVGIIREAFRLAPEILIHEPNGNNLGLKIIERLSRYHREHREKSYTSLRLKRWVKDAGGQVIYQKFAGFVPMFCPDWLARTMKAIEPVVERVLLLNACGSAVMVLVARRVV